MCCRQHQIDSRALQAAFVIPDIPLARHKQVGLAPYSSRTQMASIMSSNSKLTICIVQGLLAGVGCFCGDIQACGFAAVATECDATH